MCVCVSVSVCGCYNLSMVQGKKLLWLPETRFKAVSATPDELVDLNIVASVTRRAVDNFYTPSVNFMLLNRSSSKQLCSWSRAEDTLKDIP